MKTGYKILSCLMLLAGAATSALWYLQPPPPSGELRLAASPYLKAVDPEDYVAYMNNTESSTGVLSIRRAANRDILQGSLIEAVRFLQTQTSQGGTAPATRQVRLAPMFSHDGDNEPVLYTLLPEDAADPLDETGQPLRWLKTPRISYAALYSEPAHDVPAIPGQPVSRNAGDYRPLVENFASRYDLNADLVMAIIHSESNFSPTLVSNKSAMGLMQLLPSTASDEVHRFLYGTRGNITFAQLSQPETNIRYGTAYLHILHNRYFPDVRDREVQEACVVASYNLGPNRFLKLYGSTNEAAIAKINSMTRDEFFNDLFQRLPARETRYYVEKVRRMKNQYSSLN